MVRSTVWIKGSRCRTSNITVPTALLIIRMGFEREKFQSRGRENDFGNLTSRLLHVPEKRIVLRERLSEKFISQFRNGLRNFELRKRTHICSLITQQMRYGEVERWQ